MKLLVRFELFRVNDRHDLIHFLKEKQEILNIVNAFEIVRLQFKPDFSFGTSE